jgi:hypothetical protein
MMRRTSYKGRDSFLVIAEEGLLGIFLNVLDGLLGVFVEELGVFVDDETPSVMVFVDVSVHELE